MIVYDLEDIKHLKNNNLNSGYFINWNRSINKDDKNYSIINHIEKNSYRIKKKYLSIMFELRNIKKNNQLNFDNLNYDKNLNLWSMSQFAEKSLYKSPHLTNSLKVIALSELIEKHQPKKLTLLSNNNELKKAFEILCTDRNIDFIFKKISKANYSRGKFKIKNIFYKLPYFLRGMNSNKLFLIEISFSRFL